MRTLSRALRTAGVAGLVLVATAGQALAQGVPENGNVSPDMPAGSYLTINNTVVLILTGAVIPLLNGLLLRPANPAWIKALVANLVATIVHAFSQAIQQDGTALLSQEWLLGLLVTLVAMAASYFQVWRPIVDPNRTLPTVLPVGDVATPPEQRRTA